MFTVSMHDAEKEHKHIKIQVQKVRLSTAFINLLVNLINPVGFHKIKKKRSSVISTIQESGNSSRRLLLINQS